MALRDSDTHNFEQLVTAFKRDEACLVQTRDAATGEYRAVICAWDGEQLVPFAVMAWGNPYELWVDPTDDLDEGDPFPSTHP